MKDAAGHALSGATAPALDFYERALHEFRCYVDDPVASVDQALAAAPQLVMGHVLRAWLHLLGTEPEGVAVARESWQRAAGLSSNDRERGHLKAIELLCNHRWHDAGRVMEDVAVAYPRDALALQAGHLIDFYVGDSRMLRDRIARAWPSWDAGVPGHHAVQGMYAFGLEETGDYVQAERHGRAAAEAQPRDGWAHHAVSHVLEMQNRRDDGLAWMRRGTAWADGSFFAVHNWWHQALHHLAQDDVDAALALYDGPIDGHRPTLVLDMVDGSALLWRLALRDVDVGTRWQSLAERWAPHAGAGNYAFNDVHAAMAFAHTGRRDLLQQVSDAQARAVERDDDNARFTADVGAPVTQAVVAYVDGDFARTVALLRPVRNQAHRFGGSHAQRDLIDQTLIAAAERAGQRSLAGALRAERDAAAARRAAMR